MAGNFRFPASPPKEALAWFRAKGLEPGFDYRDVWREQHSHAFTVAKAMQMDVLTSIRESLDDALANGKTFARWKKELQPELEKLGWWGKKNVVDPTTGEVIKAQLGSPRRLRTIYSTNLRTARAAGQWQRIQRSKRAMPYLVYELGPSEKHRAEHVSWAGILLPADDPWWQTHYPPNGWGCKCRIRQVGQREYERLSESGNYLTTAPKITTKEWINDRTGEVLQVPRGIDPGWDYNPGMHQAKALADNEQRSKNVMDNALDAPLPKPEFQPQKTTKAATKWATDNNLADYADYAGIKPEVANAWNESLFDHLQEFPALRQNQRFVGTGQAQFQRLYDIQVERVVQMAAEKGIDEGLAIRWAKREIKKKKVPGGTYAHSWEQADVGGIAINKTWGKDPARFNQALADDVASQYHPIGCDSIRSVVDHELAHQLDDLLKLDKDPEVQTLFKQARQAGMANEVSRYANKNISEFIAECWAESLNNPEPRNYARRIAAIIRSRYRRQFGSGSE
ncbi:MULTISPECIES: phage minor head protein [unclassified Oceanobacter]|uniref:phage head morphogenesis protein n=1 Tax=unclassified Oceanobacter TaxID=2620260 RepID=UPI0027349AC4|nr:MULTISPECIES: phage minor head protein [unclassified Oceanobacter]MDP2607956.1 phage minor head protein [Oceanobacter sp. 1_MG-2023]MDP2611382.1 phage minor head protein [Oceanobacter sp. 2_MG-2023]